MRLLYIYVHHIVLLSCVSLGITALASFASDIESPVISPTWLSKAPWSTMPPQTWWQAGDLLSLDLYKDEVQCKQLIHNTFSQGSFSLMSLDQLNKAIENQKPLHDLAELYIIAPDPWTPWETDIRYMQSLPSFRHAAFYIAAPWAPHKNGTACLSDLVEQNNPAAHAQLATPGATYWRSLFAELPIEQSPTVGIHTDIAVLTGYGSADYVQRLPVLLHGNGSLDTQKTQCITHIFSPDIEQIIQTPELSQDEIIERVSLVFETIVKASIFAHSPELIIPLGDQHIAIICQALNRKNIINTIKKYHAHINIVYTADCEHRSAKQDLESLAPIFDLFDTINCTHYHNDRPIRLYIYSCLCWIYTYEQEKAHGSLKSETIAALHHISEQLGGLLKKQV